MTYPQIPARTQRPSPAWLFLPLLTIVVLFVLVGWAVATS
jgi:hypothetical protein